MSAAFTPAQWKLLHHGLMALERQLTGQRSRTDVEEDISATRALLTDVAMARAKAALAADTWRVATGAPSCFNVMSGDEVIANVGPHKDRAQLLAASPALVEALRYIVGAVNGTAPVHERLERVQNAASAALAKAGL